MKQLRILDTGKYPRGGVVVQKRFSLTRHRHRPASFCQTHPPTYSRPAWHAFALPCKECGSLLHQCYTFYIPQCVTILATSYWGNDALQGRYVGEVRKYSEKTKDIFVIRKAATGSLKGDCCIGNDGGVGDGDDDD